MVQILGLVLLSFFVISVLLVPFINILYKIKFTRQKQKTRDMFESRTFIFDQLHDHKSGTPVGGVALIILVTFLSFGLLGLYDDLRKTFGFRRIKFWGLRFRVKFVTQWALAAVVASMLYFALGIDIVNVRFFDVFHLGILYIPFATFTIVAFANAVNISDGLDGLATGLLLICLAALLVMSASILDTTLSIFLGLLVGSLIAFLYFNIWPARIMLGDVGAMSFGATLAVAGLLL